MLHLAKFEPIIQSKEAWKGVSSYIYIYEKFNIITMGENIIKRVKGAKVKVVSKDCT